MRKRDIIRAWRDAGYYESLSEAERAGLPAHPAGVAELTDHDLGNAVGADNLPDFPTVCTTFFNNSSTCVFKQCDRET